MEAMTAPEPEARTASEKIDEFLTRLREQRDNAQRQAIALDAAIQSAEYIARLLTEPECPPPASDSAN